MTEAIDDVGSLPGRKLIDQASNPIGKVKEIYAMDDGYPMWVAVELSTGLFGARTVFVPLARLKDEGGQLLVPYSKQRIADAPEVEGGEGISAECDRLLRDYYGIDTGDQEMRSDNKSYAVRVAEEGGAAELVDDPAGLETPDADKRTDETMQRRDDPGSSETRKVTAADVSHDDQDVVDDPER
jgi:PRC-barrel domain